MPSPRYDVARAFIQGKPASNSTGSFRSVVESSPHDARPISHLFTYNVCLATRFPDGTVHLPTDISGTRLLDKKYSQTTSIHQGALRVILSHPNFPLSSELSHAKII